MPKLLKKSEKATTKDLAKTLNVAEEATAKPKKGKTLTKPVKDTAPAPAPAKEKAAKVSSLADKKKAKETAEKTTTKTVTAKTTPAPKQQAKEAPATKQRRVVDDEKTMEQIRAEKDAQEKALWDDTFEQTMEGTSYNYHRMDDFTIEDLQKNANNITMMLAEGDSEYFSNLALCYISKKSATFIDVTDEGDDDYDSIVQVNFEDLLGKRVLHPAGKAKVSFPFALYVRRAKRGAKK